MNKAREASSPFKNKIHSDENCNAKRVLGKLSTLTIYYCADPDLQ